MYVSFIHVWQTQPLTIITRLQTLQCIVQQSCYKCALEMILLVRPVYKILDNYFATAALHLVSSLLAST